MVVSRTEDQAPASVPAPSREVVSLSTGRRVTIKRPGILLEEQLFGQIPDLVSYYARRDARRNQLRDKVRGELGADPATRATLTDDQVEAAVDDAWKRDGVRDRGLEYRVAILQVQFCSVEPRLVPEQTTTPGELWIDELTTAEFWELAAAIQTFYQSEVDQEADEIVPFSKTAAR